MNGKRSRKKQTIGSKPGGQERLRSLEQNKRLKVRRARIAREAIYMRILGGVMMAGTLYIWYGRRHVIPMSSLAIAGGILLAGVLKVAYRAGLDSNEKLQKIMLVAATGVILALIMDGSAFGFAILFFFSLISATYLFGVLKSFPGSKTQDDQDWQGG